MRKKRKNKKNTSFAKDCIYDFFFRDFRFSAIFFSYMISLAKFCFFPFFSEFSCELHLISLHHVVHLWESSIPYKHSLFWRRKKRPVWATHIWVPYTHSSKKAPKKTSKKSFRRAWISAFYRQLHFVKTKKSYKARPAVILAGQDGECAPHRSQRTIYN